MAAGHRLSRGGMPTGGIKMKNNKALGQHWLKNREILDEIALLTRYGTSIYDTLLPDSADKPTQGGAYDFSDNRGADLGGALCLEIGPGLGTLTSALLRQFQKVLAIEYDAELARKLPGQFPGKDLTVVNADFLAYRITDVPQPYVVAGNIPYYITSPIIRRLLETRNQPERIVLLMQKEVARRIVDSRETVLSLRCKNRADVMLGPEVKAAEFTPPPEVDSQVVIFTPHPPILSNKIMKFIEIGFAQPRKKVTRNLSVLMSRELIKDIFIKMNLNIDVRPHEMHLSDWEKIYEKLEPYISKDWYKQKNLENLEQKL